MYGNLTIMARFCLKDTEGRRKNKQRRGLLVIHKHLKVCPAHIIPEVSPAAWDVANEILIVCSFALGLISH